MPNSSSKHEHYDILNLLGYGLSKFNMEFVNAFGFPTKTAFYKYIVALGIAGTESTIKNRQDLFDGMTPGGTRKGWWQKGGIYKHRKDYIDSLYGDLNVRDYVSIVQISIADAFPLSTVAAEVKTVRPIIRSRYKQLMATGLEAEHYFMNNYTCIDAFSGATLDDARLFGDGYDYQLTTSANIYIAEIKGVRQKSGAIRVTQNEFEKANEYANRFALVVVSNLLETPKMSAIFDPISKLRLEKCVLSTEQTFFRTASENWGELYA